MNMDSTQYKPVSRIIRGSLEQDRLKRMNYTPYDTPDTSSSQSSLSVSKRLINFMKGKMSGAVSSIKQLFKDNQAHSIESIPLTQSLQFPGFSQEKLNSLSTSIQQTVLKPEYQERYIPGSERSSESKKTSLMNVMNVYKDVSTEKVLDTMKRQNSSVVPQSVDCQRRPVALYTEKNTVLEASRRSQGKEHLNINGKRGLRSILHTKDKTYKGHKKVSFVPELRRSSSSIIKYTSSDDEDSIYISDRTQKKIFIDNNVILKNEPIIQLSLIKEKKLKPSPFLKKRLIEKASISQSSMREKGYKKQFQDENSFNPINDSKVETDSDDASFLHDSFDSQNIHLPKSFNNKGKRLNRSNTSSDLEEKEDQVLSISSSQKHPESPVGLVINEEEESYFEQEEPVPEIPEKKLEIKVDFSKQETKDPKQMEKISLFANKITTPDVKEDAPKPKESLISLITQEPKEDTQITKEEAPKKPLFSAFNNTEETKKDDKIEQPKPQSSSGLFGGSLFTKEKIAEQAKGLFGNSSLPQKKEEINEIKKTESPFITPPVVKTEKKEETSSFLKKASSFDEAALNNPIFANILSTTNKQPEASDNPFTSFKTQKPQSFLDLIGAKPADKPAEVNAVQQPNVEIPLNDNKPKGILELLPNSQSTPSDSGLFKGTLTPAATNLSWLSGNNNSSNAPQNNLFSNFGSSNNQQTQLFGQAPNTGSDFGQMFSSGNNQKSSSGVFGNTGSMMGESGNSMFGNSGNNNNSGVFGGNNSFGNTGNTLFGGNTSQQNGGMGGMFGNNSGSNNNGDSTMFGGSTGIQPNNPFLPQSSSNGNTGGGFGGGYSSSIGSGQKKKNQKERAF